MPRAGDAQRGKLEIILGLFSVGSQMPRNHISDA